MCLDADSAWGWNMFDELELKLEQEDDGLLQQETFVSYGRIRDELDCMEIVSPAILLRTWHLIKIMLVSLLTPKIN